MAVTDAQCTLSTDLWGIYFGVQADYEQQFVTANQQALNIAVRRYKADYAKELKNLPRPAKESFGQARHLRPPRQRRPRTAGPRGHAQPITSTPGPLGIDARVGRLVSAVPCMPVHVVAEGRLWSRGVTQVPVPPGRARGSTGRWPRQAGRSSFLVVVPAGQGLGGARSGLEPGDPHRSGMGGPGGCGAGEGGP
jgi:hypothetical protein